MRGLLACVILFAVCLVANTAEAGRSRSLEINRGRNRQNVVVDNHRQNFRVERSRQNVFVERQRSNVIFVDPHQSFRVQQLNGLHLNSTGGCNIGSSAFFFHN